MKLKLCQRDHSKKSVTTKLRRGGGIPGVVYGKNAESKSVQIDGAEFKAHLRSIRPGCLATQKFTLEIEGGETCEAIVKDISYHRTTYDILHIDFLKVSKGEEVTVYVPVLLTEEDACLGISQGGQIKRVKRSVKISCKAEDLPEAFEMSVSKLAMGQALRISDVPLTKSMRLRVDEKQILVAVGK